MLRKLKFLAALAAGIAIAHAASAFTLWGPLESWQTAALSYTNRYWYSLVVESNTIPVNLGNFAITEEGGPKNFGEGSRLNTGVITYAFDYSFVTYFGVEGINAVKSAFNILNALPRVSDASPRLTEFITQGNQQINYTAQSLSMLDIKSTVLQLMMEHMGLLGETHVFDLAGQTILQTGTCQSEYFVIERNWDPLTWNPTPYVNGTLYTYVIYDGCPGGALFADAFEYKNDVADRDDFTAVATAEGLKLGADHLGLTRDDFGGLRYLYNKKNFNYEALAPNSYAEANQGSWAPVTTNAASAAWLGTVGGVEKIQFVNINFNSIFNTNWGTNVIHWTLPMSTNFELGVLDVTRSNTAPDIIFSAADLLASPSDEMYTRSNGFITVTAPQQSGNVVVPQPFGPAEVIVFNNVGPLNLNFNPGFLDGSAPFLTPYFQWGVFGGGTSQPIAFPRGANLAALEEWVTSQPLVPVNMTWAGVIATNTTATGTGAGGAAGGGAGGASGGGGAAAAVVHSGGGQ